MIGKAASAGARVVAGLGTQNKAVAGGLLAGGGMGLNTLILAGLAAGLGIGDMPPPDALAGAVEDLVRGLFAYAAVYMIPNLTR